MTNPISNDPRDAQMNNILAHQSANMLREQLGLQFTPSFSAAKAWKIGWSLVAFGTVLAVSRNSAASLSIQLVGGLAAILFMVSIFGNPIVMQLDKASQVRFEEWLKTQ